MAMFIGAGGFELSSEKRQRTQLVALRLTPTEHDVLRRAATSRGCSLSRLIREAALSEAEHVTYMQADEFDELVRTIDDPT